MQEFIHVTSGTHIPTLLGSSTTPFKFYADGFDPNDGTPFGEAHETMYLQVVRPEEPTITNRVLEKAVQQQTAGTDGIMYPGAYSAPNWVVGYDLVPQDLDAAKTIKQHMLDQARDARVNSGFALQNGETIMLPLDETFLSRLQGSLSWLENAVGQLKVEPTYTMTFSGVNDVRVTLGLVSLREVVADFGVAYYGMNGEVVAARAAIASAEDVAAVDAVAWEF